MHPCTKNSKILLCKNNEHQLNWKNAIFKAKLLQFDCIRKEKMHCMLYGLIDYFKNIFIWYTFWKYMYNLKWTVLFKGTPQETWANGTLRMNAKDLDSLYHANLYINVGTINNDRQLRGRIVQNLISPAQELSKRPILLQSRYGFT